MNYDKILQDICFGKNRINIWKINKILHNCTNIKKYLLNRFEYVESIQESLHRIKNNIEIRPVCPVCGKRVKYIGRGWSLYREHCSTRCSSLDKKVHEKLVNTCLNKYGVINGGASEQSKEKSKKTCLEKYGVEYSWQSKTNKEKSKETLLRRYNCENIQQRKITLDECNKIKENEIKENLQKSIYKHNVEQTNKIIEENKNKYVDIRNDLKHRKTCLEKYGVEVASKSKLVIDKIILTNLAKYGFISPLKNNDIKEKSKNTLLEHYGVDSPLKNNNIREKYKNTSLKCYGVENPTQNIIIKNKIKETCLERYGVDTVLKLQDTIYKGHTKETINKIIATKRKNNTFNTSKPEEELYLYIKEKFPSVIRQYKDKERYPFCCDFYIPELDLFLELNGTWTHGKHPFNINSKEDISILNTWKEKSKEHPFYLSAIETWAIRDVNKRNKAKEENLNFHEFWNIEETKQFIDEL